MHIHYFTQWKPGLLFGGRIGGSVGVSEVDFRDVKGGSTASLDRCSDGGTSDWMVSGEGCVASVPSAAGSPNASAFFFPSELRSSIGLAGELSRVPGKDNG
mmetsp:Transcript_18789/g.52354  ORF Transcript_18789/g.52354 Transcript_18789/m.52354 type:complete len:101 (-) Transcript_18789:1419-1721(-)